MKVLITGASGFVGGNLIDYLKEKGDCDIIITRVRATDKEFVIGKADAVVHLSGKAHDLRKSVDPEEYYAANTNLTIELYKSFLQSQAKVFIYISSVKALIDRSDIALIEEMEAAPITDYGKSKLAAEAYILNDVIPSGKKVYILRPCMIHGPGNKGNLNILYKVVKKGIPYPLAAFDNKRSFLSIENLCFVIYELISRGDINSGIYHISDNDPVSTNSIIKIMANVLGITPRLVRIPKTLILLIAAIGDRIPLPLNTEKLHKLTDNYLVSNAKLMKAIGKQLPVSAIEGLTKTIESFNYVD